MNIIIDNKAGKTLYTQGKYCAENIVVTPVLEEVSVTPTTTAQTKEPSAGKAGISKVTVQAIQTEEKTATPTTSAQDITPTSGKYLSKVSVGAIQTEEKAVTVTENGTTEVTTSSGKYLSKVTVTTNVPTSIIEEVSTAAEMNALLVAENVGKAYKFTGTTDSTYTNGDIYEVVQESGSVKYNVYAPYQPPQLATPTNVSVSGTTVSWDEVANAESYDVYIDNTLYENTTGGVTPTGETWVLNEEPHFSPLVNTTEFEVPFSINSVTYSVLKFESELVPMHTDAVNISVSSASIVQTSIYYSGSWVNEAYRTITFETAPTGELLTWLQANGLRQ